MKNFKKLINVFLVSFIISIILEIFLFNFRTIQSLGYKSTKLDNIVYHGIKKENKSLKVIEKDKNYIELTGINQKIKNIKLDIQILNEKQYLNYKIYATDEANQLYFALPERYYYPNIEKSKYINLNLSGKTNKIRISFSDEKDEDIEFKIQLIIRYRLIFLGLE